VSREYRKIAPPSRRPPVLQIVQPAVVSGPDDDVEGDDDLVVAPGLAKLHARAVREQVLAAKLVLSRCKPHACAMTNCRTQRIGAMPVRSETLKTSGMSLRSEWAYHAAGYQRLAV
jgi:hypothetical protein